MGSITDWISAICAAVAVVAAFVTVWWPWHARKTSKLTYEKRTYPYPNLTPEQIGQLVVATQLRRPMVWFLIRNNGDGTAHDIQLKPLDDFEARFFEQHESPDGGTITLSDSQPILRPGESCTIMLLPNRKTSRQKPKLRLLWSEEPTRLRQSQKDRTDALQCQLEPKAPLPRTEQQLALAQLRASARQTPYSLREYVDLLGLDPNELGLHDANGHA